MTLLRAHHLVNAVEAATNASDRLVPAPVRAVVDRTLVDVACASRGGVTGVAERLRVDPPALDAWRSVGVPPRFRARLAGMVLTPELGRRRSDEAPLAA